jgi:hypothetical protein
MLGRDMIANCEGLKKRRTAGLYIYEPPKGPRMRATDESVVELSREIAKLCRPYMVATRYGPNTEDRRLTLFDVIDLRSHSCGNGV